MVMLSKKKKKNSGIFSVVFAKEIKNTSEIIHTPSFTYDDLYVLYCCPVVDSSMITMISLIPYTHDIIFCDLYDITTLTFIITPRMNYTHVVFSSSYFALR